MAMTPIATDTVSAACEIREEVIIPVSPDTDLTTRIARHIGFPFALKTNLLFDAVTALNFEVEVPIRNRWSIATEWVFPWWTMNNHQADSKRHRLQLLNGNLEGRYWLGNRSKYAPLTGWFAGVYMGAGLFDIEWKRKGYQGEFFIAAGAGAGYTHPISKHLRMEYALGIGYLKVKYRRYEARYSTDERWHAVKTESGKRIWFGPTRAKVSLVWMIDLQNKKGGTR